MPGRVRPPSLHRCLTDRGKLDGISDEDGVQPTEGTPCVIVVFVRRATFDDLVSPNAHGAQQVLVYHINVVDKDEVDTTHFVLQHPLACCI